MEQDPFPELQIQSSDFLDELSARSKCSKCQKSRKFYCYTCYLPVPEIADRVPVVKVCGFLIPCLTDADTAVCDLKIQNHVLFHKLLVDMQNIFNVLFSFQYNVIEIMELYMVY